MNNSPTPAEQQQALEYLLGQILLGIEADSTAIRARLQRMEDALNRIAPNSLAPAGEEEEYDTPSRWTPWAGTCRRAWNACVPTSRFVPARWWPLAS